MITQRLGKLLCVALAFLLQACSTTSAPPVEEAPIDLEGPSTELYRVGYGDRLLVDVWRNPELSIQVPVRPDGRISMPLIGDVEVSGRTTEEIIDAISARLGDYVRDPSVSVIVTDMGSNAYVSRVRVTGAVASPISLSWRRGMTVLDLVLEAGGTTEFANADGTRLYSKDRETRPVRLRAILERGDLETNYLLAPGDIVTVPESRF